MKKIAILALLFVFAASAAFAAAITDATRPLGHMKFSASAEDNYIFKKEIESKSSLKHEIKKKNEAYAKLSMGVTPYFNLYGKIGGANGGEISTTDNNMGQAVKVDTKYGFLWGAGVSGVKEIKDGWQVGVDAQFTYSTQDADKITLGGGSTTNVGGAIADYETQVTPFIAKKIVTGENGVSLTPYLGAVANFYRTTVDKDLKYRQSGTDHTLGWAKSGKQDVGVVVGSDVSWGEKMSLNLEGRFIEETAISVGGTYKF